MAYNPQTWTTYGGTGTPATTSVATAARMTYIESGIQAAAAAADAAQVDADANANTYANMTPGWVIVIDYYKGTFGAVNAWPTVRPTNRTDGACIWLGPTDPGGVMLAGDIFDRTE